MMRELELMLGRANPATWGFDKWFLAAMLGLLIWSTQRVKRNLKRHVWIAALTGVAIFAEFLKGVITRGPLGTVPHTEHHWIFFVVLGIHILLGGIFLIFYLPKQIVTGRKILATNGTDPARAERLQRHVISGHRAVLLAAVGIVTTFVL